LLLSALLLAAAPALPVVATSASPGEPIDRIDGARPYAIDAALPVPPGAARDNVAPTPATGAAADAQAPHAADAAVRAARARAAYMHSAAGLHARRANRHIFGSTAPPPLL